MAFGYLLLATVLAITLNDANRFVRAFGTFLAALGLVMIALSIVFANLDGTFERFVSGKNWKAGSTALALNIQATVASIAVPFLVWASWKQLKRPVSQSYGLLNSSTAFGLASRIAHWTTAVLVLCLVPMGLFVSVLPIGSEDRAMFLAAHQSLGLAILVLAAFRLIWLVTSPAPQPQSGARPWETSVARAVHITLYALIMAFPLSGTLMSMARGDSVDVFGWKATELIGPAPGLASLMTLLHNAVLPLLFYGVIFAHVGAVLKHHFIDRRTTDIRRMLA